MKIKKIVCGSLLSEIKKLEYPYNLIASAFGLDLKITLCKDDLLNVLEIVLISLSEREKEVLYMIFKQKIAAKEIAEAQKVTYQAINRIKIQILKKLRKSRISKYLNPDLDEIEKNGNSVPLTLKNIDIHYMKTEFLPINMRIRNILKRNNINNLGEVYDLLCKNPDVLNSIHNFGRKSIEEIIQCLSQFIELPDGISI